MMREYDLDGVILSSGELAHDVCVCVYVRTASRSLYGSFLCVRCCYIVLPLICRSATLEHSRSESAGWSKRVSDDAVAVMHEDIEVRILLFPLG